MGHMVSHSEVRFFKKGSEDKTYYGLYVACEFQKEEVLGVYMGKYVKQKTDVKEEYQCGNIKPDRDEPYMCMHMINDPLYKYYIKGNKKESNKIKN